MSLTRRTLSAITALWIFYVIIIGIAIVSHWPTPSLGVSGEYSIGTWASECLLISGAVLALAIAVKNTGLTWWLISALLALLSVEERFMIHEQITAWFQRLLIGAHVTEGLKIWAQIPVLLITALGFVAVVALWRLLARGYERALVLAAALLGAVSNVLDVISIKPAIEEVLKLTAELCLATVLISVMGLGSARPRTGGAIQTKTDAPS